MGIGFSGRMGNRCTGFGKGRITNAGSNARTGFNGNGGTCGNKFANRIRGQCNA